MFAFFVKFIGPFIGIEFGDDSGGGGAKAAKPKGKASSAVSQKILNEAYKFDDKAYIWGSGHPPTEKSVKRGVDCSGLIVVSVMRATGIKDDRLAEGFRRSPHWRKIDKKDAKAGDILYRLKATHGGSTDHVVFVVENKKGKLKTFEAYGTDDGRIPHDDQIGEKTHRNLGDFTGALRFSS